MELFRQSQVKGLKALSVNNGAPSVKGRPEGELQGVYDTCHNPEIMWQVAACLVLIVRLCLAW